VSKTLPIWDACTVSRVDRPYQLPVLGIADCFYKYILEFYTIYVLLMSKFPVILRLAQVHFKTNNIDIFAEPTEAEKRAAKKSDW
jgi:hypothetical protein